MKLAQLHEAQYVGTSGSQMFVIYNTKVKKFAQNSDTIMGFRLRNRLTGNVSFYSSRKDAQSMIDEWKEMIDYRMRTRTGFAGQSILKGGYNKLGKASVIIDYFVVAPVTVQIP